MAKTTSTDADTMLRAYKFRLDPTQAQASALAQCAGAARYAYNLLTAHNLNVSRTRADYWHARIDAGADETTVKAELKALAKESPEYKALGFQAYATAHLTPEITRHRAAGKAIESGVDPAAVWSETERSSEPWMHTIPRRVLVSGLQSADKAWKNFFDSRTGARAGRLVGTPRFKRKGASRDSLLSLHRRPSAPTAPHTYAASPNTHAARRSSSAAASRPPRPLKTTATYASHTWV